MDLISENLIYWGKVRNCIIMHFVEVEDATIVLSVVLPVVAVLLIAIVMAVGVAIYFKMRHDARREG